MNRLRAGLRTSFDALHNHTHMHMCKWSNLGAWKYAAVLQGKKITSLIICLFCLVWHWIWVLVQDIKMSNLFLSLTLLFFTKDLVMQHRLIFNLLSSWGLCCTAFQPLCTRNVDMIHYGCLIWVLRTKLYALQKDLMLFTFELFLWTLKETFWLYSMNMPLSLPTWPPWLREIY